MRFFTGMRTDTGSLDEVGRAPILDEGKAAHVAVAAYLVLVEATCGLGVRQVCDRPGSILALRQVVRRGRRAGTPEAEANQILTAHVHYEHALREGLKPDDDEVVHSCSCRAVFGRR